MDFIAINQADQERMTTLLEHMQRHELTREEAARSLAGARLKALQAAYPARTAYDHERMYRQALVDLESRLPGWQGLSVKRHVGAH
jgi:hypothetical protein